MKILHLISGGDEGGAKTHVLTLLNRLIKEGIDIELLCIMESIFTETAKQYKIPLTIIKQAKRYDFKAILKIKDFIKKGGYDIVHCHGARANYIAFFIQNSLKAKFVTTIHSDYKLDFKDSFHKQAIFMPINAICLKSFKYILPVTNSFKKMLIERGFKKQKLFVVYNGIDFSINKNILPKQQFLNKYKIPSKEEYIYVGLVARLQKVKGLNYFLDACNIILKKHKNIIFLIAGTGSLEKQIKSFLKQNNLEQNVKMLGFIKDTDSFFNAIDINVLTSYSESFPYSLLEGAKFKKPTIATNVGGIPEMIQNHKTGLLIPPYSSTEIADKICHFINNKDIRLKLGENFYNYVYENFSDIKMAKQHIKIYKTILKEN